MAAVHFTRSAMPRDAPAAAARAGEFISDALAAAAKNSMTVAVEGRSKLNVMRCDVKEG